MSQPEAEVVAQILLDVLSVRDESGDEDANSEAIGLALARFNEVFPEPATVTVGEDGAVNVDVHFQPLIVGAVVALHLAIDAVVQDSGDTISAHDVIVRLRDRLRD